jgi:outer membrane protein assembly factor BamB
MVQHGRLGLVLVVLCGMALVAAAATWSGGRGLGNRGSFPDIAFPKNAATVWKAYLGKDFAGVPPTNAVVGDGVVVFAYGRYLFGFSADTGNFLWHVELMENILDDLLYLDGQVIISHPGGLVTARKPTDGSVIWKNDISGGMRNGPTVTDTALFYSTKEGAIAGIERRTGKFLGESRAGTKIEAGPVLFGRSLILAFPDGHIIRADDGIERWSIALPNSIITISPSTDGKTTLLVNTTNTIYNLNPSDNERKVRWSYVCTDRTPDPVTMDGNRVYFATRNSRLIALNMETGVAVWQRTVTPKDSKEPKRTEDGILLPAPPAGSPIIFGDAIYVRMHNGLVGLYGKEDGKLRWLYRLKAPKDAPVPADVFTGGPAIDGSEIYFPGTDGSLYHLSTAAPDVDPPVFNNVSPTISEKGFTDAKSFQFFGAVIDDEGSGLQPSQVTMRLDNNDLTSSLRFDPKSGYYYVAVTPQMALEPGMHRLILTAKDYRNNLGTLSLNFILGSNETAERVPVTIAGEFLPKDLLVKPGTIISWTNKSGGPRTVIADTGEFSSDAQYPDGIPNGETWVWIVPDDMELDTKIFYHDRLNGKPGDGQKYGTGLVGLIEIGEPEPAPTENAPGVPGAPGAPGLPGPVAPPPPAP